MTKPPTYDRDVGKNWHLRFRLIIQELTAVSYTHLTLPTTPYV